MEAIKQPRRIFSVYIHEKRYDVFDIDGKEHPGYNDMPKTWWLYFSDALPEGLVPPVDSEYWKPFTKGIERSLWDIKIKQHNYTKNKWDETDFRSSTSVEMWCNGRKVYAFSTWSGDRGIAYSMAKIQQLQVQMSEHPYDFFEPEAENGRKIWWCGLPATIRPKHDGWEIGVIPDYTTGLNKVEWWKEYLRRTTKMPTPTNTGLIHEMSTSSESIGEAFHDDYINWGDALSDRNIDWFRK